MSEDEQRQREPWIDLDDEAMNDFNPSFVKSFQLTDAFRLWQSKGPYPQLSRILSR